MTVVTPTLPATGVQAPNATGQNVVATVTGGTVQGILSFPAISPSILPPVSQPATATPYTNTNSFPVAVAISGGTVTVIAVNGTTVFTATGNTVVVPAGGTVQLTWSGQPSWTWTPLFAGIAGNPVASPSSVPVQPGGAVSVIFSAAPTWAWTNPPATSPPPYYAQENLLAEGAGYNPYTLLPYAQHATLSQTGLATGVSN